MNIQNLTAADVMTPDVLMAYEGWSIKRLSSFLIKNGISGAPVIASDHSLVGVVSMTDVMNFGSKTDKEKSTMVEEVYAEFVGYHYEEAMINEMASKADERCTVNKVMTEHVIQINEDMLLTEVSKVMLDAGIHRIFVTKDGIVSGVISTSNILKAVSEIQ